MKDNRNYEYLARKYKQYYLTLKRNKSHQCGGGDLWKDIGQVKLPDFYYAPTQYPINSGNINRTAIYICEIDKIYNLDNLLTPYIMENMRNAYADVMEAKFCNSSNGDYHTPFSTLLPSIIKDHLGDMRNMVLTHLEHIFNYAADPSTGKHIEEKFVAGITGLQLHKVAMLRTLSHNLRMYIRTQHEMHEELLASLI